MKGKAAQEVIHPIQLILIIGKHPIYAQDLPRVGVSAGGTPAILLSKAMTHTV